MKKEKILNIGVIGCGYWGPNLVRNFSSLANCNVSRISDKKDGRLVFIKEEFKNIDTTLDFMDIINDPNIEAVCIATPVKTHRDIAVMALNAGKHVFVEKPMASTVAEANEMRNVALETRKKLAVGHVFQFSPAVRAIKNILKDKTLGDIYHITSSRINQGPPETDVNVLWDLGPHDFSILLFLLEEYPHEISSFNNYFPFGFSKNDSLRLTNNSTIHMKFKSGMTTAIHLSWLSSNKTRLMQIFGSEGTIVYDEMLALDGKVKLYGKGIDNRINSKDKDTKQLNYQSGDIHIINLEQHEPLRLECEHFVDSILLDKPLINDAKIGLDVVRLLEIASEN